MYSFAQLLHIQEFPADSVIISQYDDGDGLYIVENGFFAGFVKHNYEKQWIKEKLSQGSCFGEIAYFLETRRTATIIAESVASLLFLSKDYKKLFMTNCPLIYSTIRRQIYKYTDDAITKKKRLIKMSVDYFYKIDNDALTELAYQLIEQRFVKGNVIYN